MPERPVASSTPPGEPDLRTLRLFDLAPHEAVVVRCGCGRITEYGKGLLQRLHRVPSDTLIYDLQFRLRCSHCNSRRGFEIRVVDERHRGDNSQPRSERIVVPGEA